MQNGLNEITGAVVKMPQLFRCIDLLQIRNYASPSQDHKKKSRRHAPAALPHGRSA